MQSTHFEYSAKREQFFDNPLLISGRYKRDRIFQARFFDTIFEPFLVPAVVLLN